MVTVIADVTLVPAGLVDTLRSGLPAMLADLAELVDTESPSRDIPAMRRSAEVLARIMTDRLGAAPDLVDGPAGPHVHWRGGGDPRVLIVGHHDTVFPPGTVATRRFAVADGRATGPGVFDMKAGIVQAVHGLAALDDISHVEFLVTSDEEVGSGTSRVLIEDRARACGLVLVLEPSADGGALKTGRKGTGTFVVQIAGRAAHAGLEPDKGVNALVEAAVQIRAIAEFGRPESGTTVTPTLAVAGTAENVVPASATVTVDARVESAEEKARVEAAMRNLTPVLPGATIEVEGGLNRPPMPVSASAELFPVAQQVAQALGLGDLDGVAVGGGSDGNFTAAIGVATLDGLGAVGGGAHADHEYVDVDAMPDRAALIAGLVAALR
jgi:glutamate carboxypeptidase